VVLLSVAFGNRQGLLSQVTLEAVKGLHPLEWVI